MTDVPLEEFLERCCEVVEASFYGEDEVSALLPLLFKTG